MQRAKTSDKRGDMAESAVPPTPPPATTVQADNDGNDGTQSKPCPFGFLRYSHAVIRLQLQQLRGVKVVDDAFIDRFDALRNFIDAHTDQENDVLFPELDHRFNDIATSSGLAHEHEIEQVWTSVISKSLRRLAFLREAACKPDPTSADLVVSAGGGGGDDDDDDNDDKASDATRSDGGESEDDDGSGEELEHEEGQEATDEAKNLAATVITQVAAWAASHENHLTHEEAVTIPLTERLSKESDPLTHARLINRMMFYFPKQFVSEQLPLILHTLCQWSNEEDAGQLLRTVYYCSTAEEWAAVELRVKTFIKNELARSGNDPDTDDDDESSGRHGDGSKGKSRSESRADSSTEQPSVSLGPLQLALQELSAVEPADNLTLDDREVIIKRHSQTRPTRAVLFFFESLFDTVSLTVHELAAYADNFASISKSSSVPLLDTSISSSNSSSGNIGDTDNMRDLMDSAFSSSTSVNLLVSSLESSARVEALQQTRQHCDVLGALLPALGGVVTNGLVPPLVKFAHLETDGEDLRRLCAGVIADDGLAARQLRDRAAALLKSAFRGDTNTQQLSALSRDIAALCTELRPILECGQRLLALCRINPHSVDVPLTKFMGEFIHNNTDIWIHTVGVVLPAVFAFLRMQGLPRSQLLVLGALQVVCDRLMYKQVKALAKTAMRPQTWERAVALKLDGAGRFKLNVADEGEDVDVDNADARGLVGSAPHTALSAAAGSLLVDLDSAGEQSKLLPVQPASGEMATLASEENATATNVNGATASGANGTTPTTQTSTVTSAHATATANAAASTSTSTSPTAKEAPSPQQKKGNDDEDTTTNNGNEKGNNNNNDNSATSNTTRWPKKSAQQEAAQTAEDADPLDVVRLNNQTLVLAIDHAIAAMSELRVVFAVDLGSPLVAQLSKLIRVVHLRGKRGKAVSFHLRSKRETRSATSRPSAAALLPPHHRADSIDPAAVESDDDSGDVQDMFRRGSVGDALGGTGGVIGLTESHRGEGRRPIVRSTALSETNDHLEFRLNQIVSTIRDVLLVCGNRAERRPEFDQACEDMKTWANEYKRLLYEEERIVLASLGPNAASAAEGSSLARGDGRKASSRTSRSKGKDKDKSKLKWSSFVAAQVHRMVTVESNEMLDMELMMVLQLLLASGSAEDLIERYLSGLRRCSSQREYDAIKALARDAVGSGMWQVLVHNGIGGDGLLTTDESRFKPSQNRTERRASESHSPQTPSENRCGGGCCLLQ